MDASSDLNKLKVAELKNELKLRGLSTVGKRSELLERLQNAIASGVEVGEGEEIDEDEILAGADDDDEGLTPAEEEQALAGTKVTATPSRAKRRSVAPAPATPATPRTMGRKLAIKRTPAASLKVPQEEPEEETPKVESPAKPVTPKAATPVSKKTPAKEPAEGEPEAKVAKTEENADEPEEKSAKDKRAERFGITKDEDAKKNRAERFGIVSQDAAKAKRQERFGVVEPEKKVKKGKMASEPIDMDKLKSRAERFGSSTAKAMDMEKKKARADRFGNGTATNGKDVTSDEAKAARAAKFASNGSTEEAKTESSEPLISASGKTIITFGSEDSDKLKRAARFATAAQ